MPEDHRGEQIAIRIHQRPRFANPTESNTFQGTPVLGLQGSKEGFHCPQENRHVVDAAVCIGLSWGWQLGRVDQATNLIEQAELDARCSDINCE